MPHVRDVHFKGTLNFLKPREHWSRRGKPSSTPDSLQEWILRNSSRHPYPCRRIHSASVAVMHVERRSNDATRRASQTHRFPRLLSRVHLVLESVSHQYVWVAFFACCVPCCIYKEASAASVCCADPLFVCNASTAGCRATIRLPEQHKAHRTLQEACGQTGSTEGTF